jgi:short-subunit dehydrogenase
MEIVHNLALTFASRENTSEVMQETKHETIRLQGKVAVITGASMGIGESIAELFVREGARVVLASRELSRVEEARTRIAAKVPGSGERSLAVACDVRRREDIERLLSISVGRFGRVDIWVNNAGFGLVDSVQRMDMDECRRMFDTNLFGAVTAMQVVIPMMREQGNGAIVNVSSIAGYIAVPYMAAYGATKHALNSFSKAARLELRNTGVHVNNVCPGYVKTAFSANVVRGTDTIGVPGSIKRGVTPKRVAKAVLDAYLKNKREVVVPWKDRLTIGMYRMLPAAFEWGMMKLLRKSE